MPKITSLEPQKKNPKRFNVYLDGQFAFGADPDLIVKYRLLPGKEVKQEDLENLIFESEVGILMERVYRLFSIRQRTEKEVRDYFKHKNFEAKVRGQEEVSDLVIDLLIERLKEKDLIDDRSFAKAWIYARRRSQKKGDRVIKLELLHKGISRDIIDEVFEQNQAPEDQENLADQALEKKIKIWEKLPELEFKKKAYDFLLRRGFDYSTIKGIVEKRIKKRYHSS